MLLQTLMNAIKGKKNAATASSESASVLQGDSSLLNPRVIFYSTSTGEQIIDPEEIAWYENGCSLNDRKRYVGLPHGYCAEATGIFGLSEIQGKRPSQEDVCVYNLDDRLIQLTGHEKETLLRAIIEDLVDDEEIKTFQQQGSCALLTIVDPKSNQVTTAHLGDSTTFAMAYNSEGRPAYAHLVNQPLHNPTNKCESEYIKANNGFVTNDRLNSCLAISRAIGDMRFRNMGLNAKPDVATHDLSIPEGGFAYVVAACDGLTEYDVLDKEQILFLILSNKTLALSQQAKSLSDEALASGSTDNITVFVVPVIPEVTHTPIFTAIYDGHGGAKVSQLCKQKTPALYEKHMKVLLESKIAKEDESEEAREDQVADEDEDEELLSLLGKPLFFEDSSSEIQAQQQDTSLCGGVNKIKISKML